MAAHRFTIARPAAGALLALAAGLLANPPAPVTAQPAAAPADPFARWPAGQKPDAVLVVTGQTYGYLQPCGCSRPQLGGLERRATLIASLKARGWPVVAVDLGDVPPASAALPEQQLLKYAAALPALRDMGYVAVGVGRSEAAAGLFQALDRYAGRKDQPPYTLAANLGSSAGGRVTPRADAFPGPGTRPMVGAAEVADAGGTAVGVVGAVGPSVRTAIKQLGPQTLLGFTPEGDALDAALKELATHPKKPTLNVLLYQGSLDEARKVAKDCPEFRVVVCLSDDSEPPAAAATVDTARGPTLVVQVGHKGRYVGVVGAYKTAAGFDLKFQLVALGEEYSTPGDEAAAERANPALGSLRWYAEEVKRRNLLTKFPAGPHPAQAANPAKNLTYVGSAACAKCHPAEHDTWAASKHGHAMDALEKYAKRPAQRQFDGECVVCHTVGFGYKGGYRDEISTPHLKHVGCESCHGPGSGHAADPKDAKLLALQSPWRADPGDRLPAPGVMAALAPLAPAERAKAQFRPGEARALNAVSKMCASCHDGDNDPRFDLITYWPKVVHPTRPAKK